MPTFCGVTRSIENRAKITQGYSKRIVTPVFWWGANIFRLSCILRQHTPGAFQGFPERSRASPRSPRHLPGLARGPRTPPGAPRGLPDPSRGSRGYFGQNMPFSSILAVSRPGSTKVSRFRTCRSIVEVDGRSFF